MNKEEILSKAQAEKKDEMQSFIIDKSMRWTYLVMIFTAGIFMIFKSFHDQPTTDICSMLCCSVAAGHIYRFIKTKERFYILMGISMALLGITAAIRFFMEY